MSGLAPIYANRCAVPPEMAVALDTADRVLSGIVAERDEIRERLVDLADRGKYRVAAVRKVALAQLATAPAVIRIAEDLLASQRRTFDLGAQFDWLVMAGIVAVRSQSQWATSRPSRVRYMPDTASRRNPGRSIRMFQVLGPWTNC
jgi:hypothetical protein